MPSPTNLMDAYIDELRDLWSANDQMQEIVKHFVREAMDGRLKHSLETAAARIGEHTATLMSLAEAAGAADKQHCRGMEGLVREAKTQIVESGSGNDNLNDLLIISQYQRMSHYGLATFGTAAAYARALNRSNDENALKSIVADIYKGDEIASRLAERLEAAAA
jgi:ferritin-like metal-binding protein YciE